MSKVFNVYCDESCHLQNDGQGVMLFGGVWCPLEERQRLSTELEDIKSRHNACGELKWTKTSNARKDFYIELIDWFIAEQPLHFRSLIVDDKSKLDHDAYNEGSHDTFYYKMYFSLLNKILSPENCYNIYLDIKDTRSRRKVQKLRDVLCNNVYDFTSQMICNIQNIRSHEADLLQLADFLLGAVAYRHRGLHGNRAKEDVVAHLEERLGRDLLHSTALSETKFNLFVFSPRKVS